MLLSDSLPHTRTHGQAQAKAGVGTSSGPETGEGTDMQTQATKEREHGLHRTVGVRSLTVGAPCLNERQLLWRR